MTAAFHHLANYSYLGANQSTTLKATHHIKLLLAVVLLAPLSVIGQNTHISTGAEQTETYIPLLSGKRVAIVANHSTLVNGKHLVDTLIQRNVSIAKIFSPEHGFRGQEEAGALINNHIDSITGLPVISLYGSKKKPLAKDLKDIDIIVFDLQDVGVRYYTYISTMHYVMEACAENNVALVVLDRPNPNGFFVDGPMLDTTYRSFVGMHPVPLVHGLTIGEFAQMINGEKWLSNGVTCSLSVIPCAGYTHSATYQLPVKPSPNLPNQTSVYLYPSLGLFEGTSFSIGRGTSFPFQVFGHPKFPDKTFKFSPRSIPGVSKNPPHKGKVCYGVDLRMYNESYFINLKSINLEWLIFAYNLSHDKSTFFNSFFNTLAGTPVLRQQIEQGMDAESIRATWAADIATFKSTRNKYLLYPDFE